MGMSTIQIIGSLREFLMSTGFRVIIDQSQAGYIYFGMAKSGSLKTQPVWNIVRLKITNDNKVNDFEWANGAGLNKADCIWNTLGGTTYNGAYSFQGD
jgi:hypothetical protein